MKKTVFFKGELTAYLKNVILVFAFVFYVTSSFAQVRTIRGRVLNSSNEPVSGATIQVKQKPSVSTVSGQDGSYSINVENGDILVFSFVGLESKEERVGSSSSLNIELGNLSAKMDEVIVIGYGTTTRKNLTTAISKVDPKVVPQAANNSVTQLLFGRAPGMTAVQNSAEPGGNINVSIRGRGNPLVVIDGVIVPFGGLEPSSGDLYMNGNVNRGGFAGINPGDIESIEFLKDASASIYGVQSANGVMIITTKKGKAGRVNVTYDGSHSWVQNMKYFNTLSASEYMTYYNQLTLDRYLIDSNMAPFGPRPVNLNGYNNGPKPPYTPEQISEAGTGTDWLSYVLQDGSIDNHNVSISGATDRLNYYFSGGFFDQKGTTVNSGLRRITSRVNLTFKLTKFLSLTANVNYGRNNYLNSQSGGQSGGIGQQGFGALQSALAYPATLPIYDPATGLYTQFNISGNPLSLLNISDRTSNTNLLANFSADITLIPKILSAKLVYGNSSDYAERKFFIPSSTFFAQLNRSRASVSTSTRENQTMEASLIFKERIKKLVNVDAVFTYGEYPNNSYSLTSGGADMLDAIGTDALGSASLSSQVVSSSRGGTKLRSYIGRTSFDVLDRYVVSAWARYDGYSQFFPEDKYAFFPGVSAAWKINNESFLRDVDFIRLLKLRASIGTTGLAGSQAYATFAPDPYVVTFNNGSTAYVPYRLTQLDTRIKWPKTINKNLGLDFSLAKDRISGSIDVFRDDLTNLLTNVTTPYLSQLSSMPLNSGAQVRQGWEVGINTTNFKRGSFQWMSMLNVSRSTLRWEERQVNSFLRGWQNAKDYTNTFYAYETDGLIGIGTPIPEWQPAGARRPGSPIFVDRNHDKKLDTMDIYRIEPGTDFTVGFGNTFYYKNFDLAVMFYGQFGGLGTSAAVSWSDALGFLSGNQSGIKEINEVWTSSNPNGIRPGIGFDQGLLGLPVGNDVGLMRTDFVRCRNITLGYTIKSGAITKFANNIRAYIDAQNPFIITKFKYADPEVSAPGVKGGPAPYPMARTISLGVRANF